MRVAVVFNKEVRYEVEADSVIQAIGSAIRDYQVVNPVGTMGVEHIIAFPVGSDSGIAKLHTPEPVGEMCLVHGNREAVAYDKVPCAPGGKIPLCAECADKNNEEARSRVFAVYKEKHAGQIAGMKGMN